MATNEEALAEFKQEMKNLGMHHHEDVYHGITRYLGPSIHQQDASFVACSDPKELEHIKQEFLIEKLGMEDGPHLDDVIQQACGGLGHSNTKKHRPTFYYLLVAILNKGSMFTE